MAYVNKIKTYTIDLSLPEEERWQEIIKSERISAISFINKNYKTYYSLLAPFISTNYKLYGGLYIEEMKSWSQKLQIPLRKIIFMNCLYSLWLLGEYLYLKKGKLIRGPKSIFGCTAGITWIKGLGNIHLRNMDYDAVGLGNATRIFIFKQGKRKFITVGMLGLVGVLSGMLPKKYAVTINYAPTTEMPTFSGYEPLMLLREVFESCDSYEEAVAELKNSRLSTGVFYVVSGSKKGQACVIERTKRTSSIRKIKDNVLAQANHFNSAKNKKHNVYLKTEDSKQWHPDTTTSERQVGLEKELVNLGENSSRKDFINCLNGEEVLDYYTYQQMIFLTTKGEYKAWRWVD